MDWQVEFYQKENGKIPVMDYLLTLNPKNESQGFLRNRASSKARHGTS